MFINDFKYNFENISDSKTVLYSAEKKSIITSIRCTNISNDNIRITLEEESLLTNPIQKSFLCYKLLVTPMQTIDLLMVTKGNSSVISEHMMFDGDNLVVYSDKYDENFSCIIVGYNLIE